MLTLPQDPTTEVSVVGLDPGSTLLGCSIIHFDLRTFQITGTEAYTLNGGKLPSLSWLGETVGDRGQRIHGIQHELLRIFNRVQPLAIACESPFINSRMPQAGLALTQVVAACQEAVFQYDTWKSMYMIEPSRVKNAYGAKGNADKDGVKAALMKIPELTSVMLQKVELLDEHAVDALAVAYSQYLAMKPK